MCFETTKFFWEAHLRKKITLFIQFLNELVLVLSFYRFLKYFLEISLISANLPLPLVLTLNYTHFLLFFYEVTHRAGGVFSHILRCELLFWSQFQPTFEFRKPLYPPLMVQFFSAFWNIMRQPSFVYVKKTQKKIPRCE